MNRNEKLESIQKLERLIEKQNDTIKKERLKLREYESKLEKISKSDLPILLFTVIKKVKTYNEREYIVYYNIYYYPDLNKYEEVKQYDKQDILKKTIDLREKYNFIISNEKDIPYGVIRAYDEEVNTTISEIKNIINYLFNKYKINSWNDLGEYLIEYYRHPKVLKKVL